MPAPPGNVLYLTLAASGSVGGVSFGPEDIVAYDGTNWEKVFDGSDVGLAGANVGDFALLQDGSILLSFTENRTLPDVGAVKFYDVVRFIPDSLGEETSGRYEVLLRGPDLFLGTNAEAIDALGFAPDGRLLVSTHGGFKVSTVGPTLSGDAQDIIMLTTSQPGDFSNGTWEMWFDGSDVAMTVGGEDIDGVWAHPGGSTVYLTTRGTFQVSGASGDGSDILLCEPISLGELTQCNFSLWFDGSTKGLSAVIDGLAFAGPVDELMGQSADGLLQSQHFYRRR